MQRHAPAKYRKTSAVAGSSSLSTARYGLPQLSDSTRARFAASASMKSATLRRSVARSFGVVCAHASAALCAACTAAWTCAGDASLTSSSFSPVAGFITAMGAPSPLTSSPAMSILWE
eukprot:Amastigsp_a176310_44.p5 type:complete len:118 gc:universal Amastigsp_a176310_44:417-64(-)